MQVQQASKRLGLREEDDLQERHACPVKATGYLRLVQWNLQGLAGGRIAELRHLLECVEADTAVLQETQT